MHEAASLHHRPPTSLMPLELCARNLRPWLVGRRSLARAARHSGERARSRTGDSGGARAAHSGCNAFGPPSSRALSRGGPLVLGGGRRHRCSPRRWPPPPWAGWMRSSGGGGGARLQRSGPPRHTQNQGPARRACVGALPWGWVGGAAGALAHVPSSALAACVRVLGAPGGTRALLAQGWEAAGSGCRLRAPSWAARVARQAHGERLLQRAGLG